MACRASQGMSLAAWGGEVRRIAARKLRQICKSRCRCSLAGDVLQCAVGHLWDPKHVTTLYWSFALCRLWSWVSAENLRVHTATLQRARLREYSLQRGMNTRLTGQTAAPLTLGLYHPGELWYVMHSQGSRSCRT